MSIIIPCYFNEMKKWFSWYDMDDEVDYSQFLHDYFAHYELTQPLISPLPRWKR
jgi:hypothetical protein